MWYFDRAYYGFYMASCRVCSPYTRRTKSEAAEFKELVFAYNNRRVLELLRGTIVNRTKYC